MAKREFIECSSGDVVIQHAAYSGCSRPESDRMTWEQAMHVLASRMSLYRKQGYPVNVVEGSEGWPTSIEVESPDDAGMVGDIEGTFTLVPVMVPAGRCLACDDLVPVGEECPCWQFQEEDR